jgi:hypothetical protein
MNMIVNVKIYDFNGYYWINLSHDITTEWSWDQFVAGKVLILDDIIAEIVLTKSMLMDA